MTRPVVGVIGAGQLARMMLAPAAALDVDLRLLAARPDDGAARAWPRTVIGRPDDADAVLRFADDCDVVTFDHELVPPPLVERLAGRVTVRPGPSALLAAQDKAYQRRRFAALGLPVPAFAEVGPGQLHEAASQIGHPVVVKAPRGGYDGRGVAFAATPDELEPAWRAVGAPDAVLLEQRLALEREVAVLVARTPDGRSAEWPVVDTRQDDGILVELTIPAAVAADTAQRARALAARIAEELDVIGVMAVELFVTAEGLMVNEIALRPHNSGHWTIEGAVTSQFEQHLRAVVGWPLGSTVPTAAAVASVNVLGRADGIDPSEALPAALRHGDAHIHLYGKEPHPGRKVGHVTVCADDATTASARARAVAAELMGTP